MFRRMYLAFLLLSIAFSVFAQQVGKISGVVRDKANGEPLPGVNVVVEESLLGASTDADGSYVILNVPPGNYTISFDYIGYQTVKVENVRVVADITKRLDMDLSTTTIEIDEAITVVAEKPFFEVAATNTVRVLDSEEIERIPVKGVNTIVSYNAGVVVADGSGGETDNATINVRGGRGNETLLIVDGIPYNDVLFGNAAGTIPDGAIEQISSQIGGFSAKYGSAQSGVVNVTTKSGASKFFGSADFISSSATDDFNYNSFTGTLGGPLGSKNLSFLLSGEYLSTDDESPRANGLVIPTVGINSNVRPDMEGEVARFVGKVDGKFERFKLTLSTTGSFRKDRNYIHSYAKTNSAHNPRQEEDVIGASLRFSHVINPTTFWDVTLRGKYTGWEDGDGVWFRDLEAYGDSARIQQEEGVTLPLGDGTRIGADPVGVFWGKGRVSNQYTNYEIQTGGIDLNFTKQFENHLLEIGGTVEQHQVRFYRINPVVIARRTEADGTPIPADVRYNNAIGVFYGYDLFGNEISDGTFRTVENDRFEEAAPKRPMIAGAYLQDRIEFDDFILNLGFRWDYFNADHFRFKDPNNIYGFGSNPNRLDEDDLEDMPSESYISPRLGFAFPMTERTVFHAQYGVFRQPPRFFDIYDSWNNLQTMEQRDGQGQSSGHLEMEKTTQYEFGFKQQIGNLASLDISAYYKNVEGLVNLNTLRTVFGQTNRTYISTVNQDFGTIKGLAFSFNLRRLGPVSTKIDYTLALSEGTGSDPSSSRNATFRNPGNEVPVAIAPLDFDQRHTFNASVDIRGGKDEGPMVLGTRLFANAGANFLFTYNSGRPYTPVVSTNPLPGVDASLFDSEVAQYINSAYISGIQRLDMRIDKEIYTAGITLIPYLVVQNLLDRDNFIQVWRATGKPDDSGWINTPEGQARLRREIDRNNGEAFLADLKSVENDPSNFGIPRLIRLGLKVRF